MSGYFSSQLNTDETEAAARRQCARLGATYGHLIAGIGDGPVLDIGPGRGELLEVLAGLPGSAKRQLWAIDTDREVTVHIMQRYTGVKAVHGDPVDVLQDSDTRFSAIFMLHVLEHLDADYAVRLLTLLRQRLASDGVLVIEVPNSACSFVGNTIYGSDVTHKVPYTSISLKQVCRMAGFEQIEVVGIRPKGGGLLKLLQRALTALLMAVDAAVHRILLPAWRFLHEPTIYAVCRATKEPHPAPVDREQGGAG